MAAPKSSWKPFREHHERTLLNWILNIMIATLLLWIEGLHGKTLSSANMSFYQADVVGSTLGLILAILLISFPGAAFKKLMQKSDRNMKLAKLILQLLYKIMCLVIEQLLGPSIEVTVVNSDSSCGLNNCRFFHLPVDLPNKKINKNSKSKIQSMSKS